MSVSCNFCKTLILSALYIGFFYAFFTLGQLPFMLFVGASVALAFAQWLSAEWALSFRGIIFGLLMAGSAGGLLYFIHNFYVASTALTFYPFVCVWVHDAVGRCVDKLWGSVRFSPDLAGSRTVLGVLAGFSALCVLNWHVAQSYNPLAFVHFPTTPFGLLGYSGLSSILMVIGAIMGRRASMGQAAEGQSCPPSASLSVLRAAGSFILFGYLIVLISFGRHLFEMI